MDIIKEKLSAIPNHKWKAAIFILASNNSKRKLEMWFHKGNVKY